MKHIGNYTSLVVNALILVALTPTATRSQVYVDEVIEDVVEQLFGRAVQEEFEESVQNCADALTEIKKTSQCITDRNISFARINQTSVDRHFTKQLCDDLFYVGKCFNSLIVALQSCADQQAQKESLENVKAALDAGLQYFCKDGRGEKLNQLFKEGFPQCFTRRSGRILVRCFPARSGELHVNYWGDLENENFFNQHNCLLLRNHTTCVIDRLKQCPDATRGVSAFHGVVETVMDELGCSEIREVPQNMQSSAGIALPTMWPCWSLIILLFVVTRRLNFVLLGF